MKISDLEIGYTFNHPKYGRGVIISVTKRTVTAVFNGVRSKITYRSNDEYFNPCHF